MADCDLFVVTPNPCHSHSWGLTKEAEVYSGDYETDISVGAKDIKVTGLAAFAALKDVRE